MPSGPDARGRYDSRQRGAPRPCQLYGGDKISGVAQILLTSLVCSRSAASYSASRYGAWRASLSFVLTRTIMKPLPAKRGAVAVRVRDKKASHVSVRAPYLLCEPCFLRVLTTLSSCGLRQAGSSGACHSAEQTGLRCSCPHLSAYKLSLALQAPGNRILCRVAEPGNDHLGHGPDTIQYFPNWPVGWPQGILGGRALYWEPT
jgi:hypothetical protein